MGTALPVIVSDLHGREFEWVGSAYALSATAFLPLSGGLAQVCVLIMFPIINLIKHYRCSVEGVSCYSRCFSLLLEVQCAVLLQALIS